MAILNYTTKISANKTIGEISEILASNGAKKITMDYDVDGVPSSITFSLITGQVPIYFALPANYEGMLNAMKCDQDVPVKYCTREQAIRTAWRVIKDWIHAQCAIVQAGLVEMPEVFLPYAITKDGQTLYKAIKEHPTALLGQ